MSQARATLILSRADIARAMTLEGYVAAVERAFAQAAKACIQVPQVMHLAAADGGFHVKAAAYAGDPHYVAVKVNGNFPANPRRNGLPTIQGAVLLADARNGALLAILDSAEITAMRTGAATAVAAKYLARPDARTAAVIGCGTQGRIQLLSLCAVLPIERVRAFDIDPQRAERFAAALRDEAGCEVRAAADLAAASAGCDVIVTCTPARAAFLGPEHVAPGTFIAAVGADHADKQELRPSLMARARVFVDHLEQCAALGDLHHAIAAGVMTQADVVAELGAVVAGQVRPDLAADAVAVFDSTGTASEDVAAAGAIFERARAAGIGREIELS